MRKDVFKKGMVLAIIALFLCAGIPIVNSIDNGESPNNEINKNNIIFHDDFNDNEIDYVKWPEYESLGGDWNEINGRTEFKLYEKTPEGTGSKMTIKSSEFQVTLSNNIPIILSCDIISDIEHYQDWQWIGGINIILTDGTNFVELEYSRAYNELRYWDSNDEDITILPLQQDDDYWNNEIVLYSNKYSIKMNEQYSGIINDEIFSNNPNLKIILQTYINGDYSDFWWKAGFDNALVYTEMSIPTVEIIYPNDGDIFINNIVTIEGTANYNDGNIDYVEVKIDDGDWQLATGTNDWSYIWYITQYEQGEHKIFARSIGGGISSIADKITVYVDYRPPEITIDMPSSGEWHNGGKIWFNGEYLRFCGNVVSITIEILDTEFKSNVEAFGNGIWGYKLDLDTANLKENFYSIRIEAFDDKNCSAYNSTGIIIDRTEPQLLDIIDPREGYFYRRGWGKFFPLFDEMNTALILGDLNIGVEVKDYNNKIEVSDFFDFEVTVSIKNLNDVEIANGKCKTNNNVNDPIWYYSWNWFNFCLGKYTLEVTARDLAGNTKTDSVSVIKLG